MLQLDESDELIGFEDRRSCTCVCPTSGCKLISMDQSDGSAVSFLSWATNVTKCSNPAFDTVLSRSWTDSGRQQDVLTVLTGITKLIHDKGGTESAAEYYAALLTALNTQSTTKAAEAYLLKLIICRAVPDLLLRSTFAEAAKIIVHLLGAPGSNTEDIILCKSLIVCLGRLLSAQLRESWSLESVRHIYRHLLRFVDHEKPPVRKSSHIAVRTILNVTFNESTAKFHPACHQTVESLCTIIRQEVRQLVAVLRTKEVHCVRLLHCLELLTSILPLLPSKEVKAACECILELVEFPNPLVVSKAFSSVQSLFENRPSVECLSVDLAARLLTALYTYRPGDPAIFEVSTAATDAKTGFTGLEVLVSWIRAVRAGCSYLCDLSSRVFDDTPDAVNRIGVQRLTLEHLDRLIKGLLDLLMTTPLPKLRKIVSDILDGIFIQEFDALLLSTDLRNHLRPVLMAITNKLGECMRLSRYETWVYALALTARLLRIWPRVQEESDHGIDPALCQLLKQLAQLRDSLVDGAGSLAQLIEMNAVDLDPMRVVDTQLEESVIDELDRVCLVALESFGPDLILQKELLSVEPLVEELENGVVELRRSWFLPLLARAQPANPCRLNFFVNHILTLADRSLAVARDVTTSSIPTATISSLITAGVTIARQLWAGLSMFVRHAPLDWSELSTGGFGRRLVNELSNAPALRPIILLAFRRLAKFAYENDAGLSAMQGGSKLAIPAMLSLYEHATLPKDLTLQQQIRATLNAYLPCLTAKMIAAPATVALQKLNSTQNPVYLDILQIVIPHTTSEEIEQFLPNIIPILSHFNPPSRVLQKRAYRLLELICAGVTPSTKRFLETHLNDLLSLMQKLSDPVEQPATSNQSSNHITDDIAKQVAGLSVVESPGSSGRLKMKKKKPLIPWKPRLRALHHLLGHLIAQELDGAEELAMEEASKGALGNQRFRNFANMFIPEILAAVCESNRIVRDLAGRITVNLILAFAGLRPNVINNSSSLLSSVASHFDTRTCISVAAPSVDSEDESSNDKASSIGQFTCADEDEILSTKSMPRGGVLSERICAALHLLFSRLWSVLPPSVPLASNPTDLVMQESAARVVCHLLKHLRFRRALLFSLESDNPTAQSQASAVIDNAMSIAQRIVSSQQRPLARYGLQLIRLLLAFVGSGSVCLTDMKVVRNSARIMARRERNQSSLESIPEQDEAFSVSGKSRTSAVRSSKSVVVNDKSSVSGRTHLSLPPRVHMPRFDELLADSSDDEALSTRHEKARSIRSNVSSKRNQKITHSITRGKSLVEELESVAETSGLCRRARKRVLRGPIAADSSSDEDDGLMSRRSVAIRSERGGIRRKVQFVDTASLSSTSQLGKKQLRMKSEDKAASGLWLVEQPDQGDVLDLSDPKALARHTAIAANADAAMAMAKTLQNSNSARKPSTAPFPVVDGKIIVDDPTASAKFAKDEQDWDLEVSDEEFNNAPNTWSGQKQPKLKKKPQIPGQIYASKKAKGDMRRAGKPDPYAYISLGSGLGGAGKTATAVERRRLLRAVGIGKQKRSKRIGTTTGPLSIGRERRKSGSSRRR
ncbi:ribosomal RNA-processing protein 12 [Clonorchis sinensis]|uniref:Ribosomal RNA-processing protein 12 n=1 Tax=Clonorchis sinensis TaxID=79923 RepID=G7YL66_CLOSI|nr:ribosomal RNA-processing protein 12 [Clonorchis sinensis]